MIKPNRLTNYLMGLVGKTFAYNTALEVNQELDRLAFQTHAKREQEHKAGAARLHSPLAFQPGLISEHTEIHDSLLFVTALLSAAIREGHTDLADKLRDVEHALGITMHQLGQAAALAVPTATASAE